MVEGIPLTVYGYGGGLYSDKNSILTITESEINANTSNNINGSGGGGGVYAINSQITIEDSDIIGNQTIGDDEYGGGLFFTKSSTDNYGVNVIQNSTITGNSSRFASAIFANEGVRLQIHRSIIEENHTTGSTGGTIYAKGAIVSIINSIIINNTYPTSVPPNAGMTGGIYITESPDAISIVNTIIYGNQIPQLGFGSGPKYLNIMYSNLQDGIDNEWWSPEYNININTDGELEEHYGTITTDSPNLADDYTLTESSLSCIDLGIATIAQYDNDSYAEVYSFSIDETLINGNAPDIGVYESEYTASNDACGNGDVNGDDSLNVLDIVQIVNYILAN